ncbi:MAG: NADH-quinone oxidoreductase subunit C [candidate division Zixibacteria bacterium]|nr:NADH-quinone oxidoreductase subunit C [candidate division Zixibacteria bacterium]
MTVPEIIDKLKEEFEIGILKVTEFRGDFWVQVNNEVHHDLMETLYRKYNFEFLSDIVGVDYPRRNERADVIYNLYSIKNNQRIFIKLQAGGEVKPRSVTDIWNGADWMEREVYDLLGVQFTNHPNLKRILMRDDFPGHPLRKDFTLTSDEVDFGVPIRTKPSGKGELGEKLE